MAPRVLLVEDESLVAMLLEDMLTALGYEIAGVASRLEPALQLAEAAQYDVAVLDVNLGGAVRSFPVADRLRARGIPFVFATGYGTGCLGDRTSHAPVVRKPFGAKDLARALDQARSTAGT